jgi:putative redox protein
MDTLLLSVAGCMAVDVKMILEKSRVPVTGLRISVEGERAQTHPKRFTRMHLTYHLEGPQAEDQAKVDRAVSLSKETFCSVLHTLRQDIELEIETHLG